MRWLTLLAFTVSCMHNTSVRPRDAGPASDTAVADVSVDVGSEDVAGDQADAHAQDGQAPDVEPDRTPDTVYQDITIGTVVTVGPSGDYATIQDALDDATPHSTILVADGTYDESLTISKGGTSETDRLLVRAENPGGAVVQNDGRVLRVDTPWVTVQGFVFDGQWSDRDVVEVTEHADHLILRDLEIKNSERDGIDLGGGSNGGLEEVLIDGCTVHHMLRGSTSDQLDAHCIVATDFFNLTIRDTEAYYCSGDSVQVGTDRDPWEGLVIEDCHFWTGPLPDDAAGFYKDEVPGENALDTKAEPHSDPWKGTITLRDSVFSGFDLANGYISNRAALNLKDQITGLVERCILYDNEIGFRVRGDDDGNYSDGGVDGLLVKNTLLYRNQFHVRVEDNAKNVIWHHNTFGQLVDDSNATLPIGDSAYGSNVYKNGGGGDEGPGWQTDNNLYLGASLPSRTTGSGDLATDDLSTFVDFSQSDYHLAKDLDAANGLGVLVDLDQKTRSTNAPDVGAYER